MDKGKKKAIAKEVRRLHFKKNWKWLAISMVVIIGAMGFMDYAGVEQNIVLTIGIGVWVVNLALYFYAEHQKVKAGE